MKPDPHVILRALDALTAPPNKSVVIGDSSTDVLAGHAAGTQVIGYANRPGKVEQLVGAGANAVTTNMSELTVALTTNAGTLGV